MRHICGTKPLIASDFIVGMNVWISANKADELSMQWMTFDDSRLVDYGRYVVEDIQHPTPDLTQPEALQIIANITVKCVGNPNTKLTLDYNPLGSVILGSAIKIDNAVYHYITSIEELDRINEGRRECAVCDSPLNIPFGNLRICNKCEEELKDITEEICVGGLLDW